jgi:hypothetical protein
MEMKNLVVEESFATLKDELERGEDICEALPLIHEAAQTFGGQSLFCGEPSSVDTFFATIPSFADPSLAFEWLRISMSYANDGGVGLRSLAKSWTNSSNPHKAYISQHIEELV